MLHALVSLLPEPFKTNLRGVNRRYRRNREIRNWRRRGSPFPPPHALKENAIDDYRREFRIKTLVESGTYLGDMVMAQKDNFQRVYSIELGADLWRQAKKRFEADRNVEILQGDSGSVLVELMPRLNGPAIFWLDGHYSAGVTAKGEKVSPIMEELNAIFMYSNAQHVLLIDDARLFKGDGDYPSIEDLKAHVAGKDQGYEMTIKDDIIRFTKPQ